MKITVMDAHSFSMDDFKQNLVLRLARFSGCQQFVDRSNLKRSSLIAMLGDTAKT